MDTSAVGQRLVRVHEVLDLCINRRMQGEALSDEQIIASHPELMPELAHELRGLAMIERARRSASSRSRKGHSSSVAGGESTAQTARSAALIPGYELVRAVHSGAQGVVYHAVQRSTQRNVAIKVMREAAPEGLRELSRFEREVQILATLRHPNIVSIHDSGLTPDGRAYFVMDFIEGRALDEWIAAQRGGGASGNGAQRSDRAAISAFLRVFATICDAVHAAHLRGVIHRDLKPANIRIDATGQPHVLDFGLAKNVGQPADSQMTVTGQFIGSLPWASPEQADGAIEKIDVRTDVYSLGVVLFGGLTGQFPYDISGPMRDVLERIITAQPRRPSSYLRSGARAAAIGDDLDTIALKCLSKEPDRRYQSAGELARDIRAYLSGEPIEARRNSAFYLLRKRMVRYRAALAGGSAALIVISALAGYAAIQAKENRERAVTEGAARRSAEDATQEAKAAQQEASRLFAQASAARLAESEQRERSEREAQRAQAVTDFLVRTLGMADPDVTQSSDLTMRSLLDRASGEIESAFADQPASEASLRLVVGRAYAALGELELALPQLERAHAIRREEDSQDYRDLYEVLWPYTQVLEDLGDERWREVWGELARTNRVALVREFPSLAIVLEKVAAALNEPAPDLVAVREHRNAMHATVEKLIGTADPRWMLLADWSALYGATYAFKGKPKHACEMLRDALEIQRRFLPETNTRIVRTLGNLVEALIDDEQYAEAERITLEEIGRISRVLSADHWYVAVLRSRLAASLIGQGRLDEAETILRDVTPRLEAGLVEVSRHRMYALSYSAWLADARDQPEQADELRREVARRLAGEFRECNRFDLLRYAVRPSQRAQLSVLDELFTVDRTQRAEFERVIGEAFSVQKALFADDDPRASVLGDLYYRLARTSLRTRAHIVPTGQLFDESARLASLSSCLSPWKQACALFGEGLMHERRTEFADGERCARQALAIVEPQFGDKLGFDAALRSLLAGCLAGQLRFDEAAPLAEQAFDDLSGKRGSADYDTRVALNRFADLCIASGRAQDALPAMRRHSRDYKVGWRVLRPALAACYPDLARELDSLARVRPRDPQSIADAVARVLAARRAALDSAHPDALLYANAAYDFADVHLMVSPDPAWAPLFRDLVETESALFHSPRKASASRLWWYAVMLVEGGAFDEAEGAARQSLEITRHFDAVGARTHAGRAVVLARALAGQGRSAEALPLLEGSIEALTNRMDNRNAVQFIASVLDVYPRAGQTPRVGEILVPYLERVLAESRDPTFLTHVATRLSAAERLHPPLRHLAIEAARRATELRPNDSAAWSALAAAASAAGDDSTAAAARERMSAIQSQSGR